MIDKPDVRSTSPWPSDFASQQGLVSVIIPTYNRAAIVVRAIESALSQTYRALEVVIVDDGSTDNTSEVVGAYGSRVRYLRQENAGVSAARNLGLRQSRGEFLALLDSDDTWEPWKVEAQVAALQMHQHVGLVWTDMSAVSANGSLQQQKYLRTMYSAYDVVSLGDFMRQVASLGDLGAHAPSELHSAGVFSGNLRHPILLGNLFHTSTVLFRKSWCAATGGFDESYKRAGEDYEFYVRLASVGDVIFIDAPSVRYQVGAADQLTAPAMMFEIARNNLRTLEKWSADGSWREQLAPAVMRHRFAESLAWLGEAELDAGDGLRAARSLLRSVFREPRLDRRVVLMVSSILPSRLRQWMRMVRDRLKTVKTARVEIDLAG